MPASVWVLVPLAGVCVAIVAIYAEHRQKIAIIEKGIKKGRLDRDYEEYSDPGEAATLGTLKTHLFFYAPVI